MPHTTSTRTAWLSLFCFCLIFPAASENAAPIHLPAVPGAGLVGEYRLDGNANDSSGLGNHGVMYNGSYIPGIAGSGAQFDGSLLARVEVTHRASLSPSSTLTLAAWVKIYRFHTPYSGIVYKAGETPTSAGFKDRVYTLWLTEIKGVHFTSTPLGASAHEVCETRGELYELDEFIHVAGLIDAPHRRMALYVNGQHVQDCLYQGSAIRGGSYPLRLGGYYQTVPDQSGLDGIIDEVLIYNRLLTESEIAGLAGRTRLYLPAIACAQ